MTATTEIPEPVAAWFDRHDNHPRITIRKEMTMDKPKSVQEWMERNDREPHHEEATWFWGVTGRYKLPSPILRLIPIWGFDSRAEAVEALRVALVKLGEIEEPRDDNCGDFAAGKEVIVKGGTFRDELIEEPKAVEQLPPVPNDSDPLWELVIADMKARDKVGRQRYGTSLQANNGRDALRDAYEEALDMAVYLKQAIVERDQVNEELESCKMSLEMYRKLYDHALECVDVVFQETNDTVPLLPEFLRAGDDKFEGVKKLAIAYLTRKAGKQ